MKSLEIELGNSAKLGWLRKNFSLQFDQEGSEQEKCGLAKPSLEIVRN